jgi:hypothetical protein
MKDMRQLLNLMEGVMAVPGMGKIGGSESDMQTAGTVGRNAAYAEFDSAQQPVTEKAPPGMEDVVMKLKKEYPNDHSKAFATAWSIYNKKHGKAEEGCSMEESVPAVDSCQQTNPATADVACAMEESVSDLIYDQQYSRFSDLMNSYVEPQEAFDVISREMSEQGIEGEEHDAIMQRLESDFFPDDSAFDMMNGPDDFSDDAEALASAGHGSDEDYGSASDMEFEEAFDMQNGYNDVDNANGNDFFPNGADGPVVRAVGPSGARQGDNPEQKKMQVAEVHKELVYGYRNFLKESAQAGQKKKLTESAQVADIKVTELHENPYADSDSITYDGSISLSATAMNRNGQPAEIGYSVDVKAEAGLGWESDESPTGWNYKTDNPTYTSYEYATSGDISVTSVQFTDGAEYYVNNDAMELQEFYQHFDPAVLKQLLNPEIYVKALGSSFDSAAEKLEPPEPDFDEPERDYGDSRY